ncbi:MULTISPECIES: fimbrillin family protein [Parabacteroides]|uniref:Fimbrillin family protein n=4 Tax=Parabacteroides goldsteinii TaxID=328812 RepID=A0A6G1ZKF1_9BACT|nr:MULTISPECIES: fimbrillin family protein [Parabacteroides]EOS19196.1 hypothetical protein C803_01029 [Parabacteroides goldsteinii dnLKV18]KAI4361213.1 hypothetical protein C825_003276 [Parabacteroides sp. ASF519]MBF0767569.1 fimbrillin family protein [Parabacteroides goldsteinii]MDZ3929752.1 fimbrillin family protein [Parabacteroides goldsteinii]MRX94841.1 hypothetical protein [Parabacteroides goldsteinii]
MKQTKLPVYLMLLATLSAGSCSNEDAPYNPNDDPDAVELGITAGVALTKSAINKGTDDTNFKSIAVYAVGPTTSYGNTNNYALYTKNGTWASSTDKIYLTSETATIYGYHPAYTPGAGGEMAASGTALKLTTVAENSTIPVTVFPGTSDSKDTNNTIPTTDNASGTTILSAPGEVDYMWAEDADNNGNPATASNGKAAGSPDASVALKMKHAMAMVSFRIYNDGTYANTGKLTKIVLKNKSNTALSQGSNPVMAIKDGTITSNAEKTVTFTRFIGDGYTLKKQGGSGLAGADAAKDASSKFSILVLPHNGAKNTIQVEFTIDNTVYAVDLAATSDAVNWAKGTNTLYTAKLSGKELTLSSITVEGWGNGATTGELPVN